MSVVTKKRCRRCLVEKPASAFHKHQGRPDGLQHWCKRCLLLQLQALRVVRSVAKVNERREEIQARVELGKACGHCCQVKPLVDFSTDSRKPDGRKSTCKDCAAPARREAWAKYRAKGKATAKSGHVSNDPAPERAAALETTDPALPTCARCANFGDGGKQ